MKRYPTCLFNCAGSPSVARRLLLTWRRSALAGCARQRQPLRQGRPQHGRWPRFRPRPPQRPVPGIQAGSPAAGLQRAAVDFLQRPQGHPRWSLRTHDPGRTGDLPEAAAHRAQWRRRPPGLGSAQNGGLPADCLTPSPEAGLHRGGGRRPTTCAPTACGRHPRAYYRGCGQGGPVARQAGV
jgi:hypothetical protein